MFSLLIEVVRLDVRYYIWVQIATDSATVSYELPDITLIPADTLQTIDTVINALSEVKKEVIYTVTAPNGEDKRCCG